MLACHSAARETRCQCGGCRAANLDARARAMRHAVERRYPKPTKARAEALAACEQRIAELAKELGCRRPE